MRKNIKSTHKLPRNLLHEIVQASWAEILILGLLIDIPHYWFLGLVDHKQLYPWQCMFIENKRKRQAGRKEGKEAQTTEIHHMHSNFMLLLFVFVGKKSR